MDVNQFLSLPREAVFVIEQPVTRCFYINYSTSMGQGLARLYDRWNGKPRAGTLVLRVLVSTPDIETLKLHTEYWRRDYLSRGWNELESAGRVSLRYKAKIVVAPNFKSVDVRLVTARGDMDKIVGRFKTAAAAQEFIDMYYGPDNPLCLPVYACNSLTKELILDKGDRRLTIR